MSAAQSVPPFAMSLVAVTSAGEVWEWCGELTAYTLYSFTADTGIASPQIGMSAVSQSLLDDRNGMTRLVGGAGHTYGWMRCEMHDVAFGFYTGADTARYRMRAFIIRPMTDPERVELHEALSHDREAWRSAIAVGEDYYPDIPTVWAESPIPTIHGARGLHARMEEVLSTAPAPIVSPSHASIIVEIVKSAGWDSIVHVPHHGLRYDASSSAILDEPDKLTLEVENRNETHLAFRIGQRPGSELQKAVVQAVIMLEAGGRPAACGKWISPESEYSRIVSESVW